ncbi:MAG: ABC transporter ATP-binding protein [Lachnospiraceae bacterium]|jgi:ABC-type lipoprotein export system ATPase subunit|nr:ABC transporter ATP-binding protein [Lachnospiraceae bacterium]
MVTLSVENISYSYRTKYQIVPALKEVNCTLQSGKFYALIGKSGSGKTTFLSLIAGLERPQSGAILVNGKDLKEMNVDQYRRTQASVIYQNFNLFPLMTVQENVMYPLILNKQTKKQAAQEAEEVLKRVGLDSSYWKRLPSMLSGGEQQRVAIARALAIHAELILADEPTGNLDTENSKQIIGLLHQLVQEERCCVLVVTHDMEIKKTADVIYNMDSGRLWEEGV